MADENAGDTAGTAVAGTDAAAGASETETADAGKLEKRATDLTRIVSEKEGALRDLQSQIDKRKAELEKLPPPNQPGQHGISADTDTDFADLDRKIVDQPGKTVKGLISPLEERVRQISEQLETKNRELAAQLESLAAKSDGDYQANKDTIDALMAAGLPRGKAMETFAKLPKQVQVAARVAASTSTASQAVTRESDAALPSELESELRATPTLQYHLRGLPVEEQQAILKTAFAAEEQRVKGR